MSHGWSESDKNLVRAALGRAQKRANDEVLQLFKKQTVRKIEDVWALERKIGEWRRERYGKFYFDYSTIESVLAECIRRGWLNFSDLQPLSEIRLEKIKKMA